MCVCGKTVWKSLLQNSTKSPRELVESSVAAADPQADEDTWSHVNIGLWPDDDGEINILTNNIGLWPEGDDDDDDPDETSPADGLHNSV